MSVMETSFIYIHISTRDATPTEIHEKQLQHRDKCRDFKWKRDNWVIYTLLLNPLIYKQFETFFINIKDKTCKDWENVIPI